VTIKEKRKRGLRPANEGVNWRIYIFTLNELEKDIVSRGFKSIPNQVNVILTSYFNDEVLQRSVDINDINLTSMSTIPANWRIRTRIITLLRQDSKKLDIPMSTLANNILMRYALGQRVQRGLDKH